MGGGYASSGFEIGNVLDRRTYPAARLRRMGPDPQPAQGADPSLPPPGSPPSTRNVNFFIEVGANQRSTRSFGPLRGPAIVERVVTVSAPIAANNDFAFFPGYWDGAVEEALVAAATPISWATWFERMPLQGGDFLAPTRGI